MRSHLYIYILFSFSSFIQAKRQRNNLVNILSNCCTVVFGKGTRIGMRQRWGGSLNWFVLFHDLPGITYGINFKYFSLRSTTRFFYYSDYWWMQYGVGFVLVTTRIRRTFNYFTKRESVLIYCVVEHNCYDINICNWRKWRIDSKDVSVYDS